MTFSLSRYVREHFSPVKVSGEFLYVTCFVCHKDEKLWINVLAPRPWYYCFRCLVSGDQIGFIARHQQIPFYEARLFIENRQAFRIHPSDIAIPPSEPKNGAPPLEPKNGVPPSTILPVSYLPIRPRINEQVGASERLAFRYLVRRGVSPEQIALYRLGYANSGKYCGYVIVPIVRRREVIYFVARSFLGGNGARKYLNPSRDEVGGIGKSELLFNYDRVSYAPILTITEGVFDAIAVGTNAVALLGKTISDVQLALLENLRVRRIRVMLDEDARAECYTMVDQLNDAGFDATPALVDGDPSSSRGRAVDVLPSFTGRVEALLAQGGRR